jgi:hypothetical protein
MKNLLLGWVEETMSKGTLMAAAQPSPTREVAVDVI